MECGAHNERVILNAFSNGKCKVCGDEVVSSHTPCDVVCKSCSIEKGFCQVCGFPIKIDYLELIEFVKIFSNEYSGKEWGINNFEKALNNWNREKE